MILITTTVYDELQEANSQRIKEMSFKCLQKS